MHDNPAIAFHPPFYLLTGIEPCWKCGTRQTVGALAASSLNDDDYICEPDPDGPNWISITYIEDLPASLLEATQSRLPLFQLGNSKTAGLRYFMNHCECGATFGDYFLHHPDGPFFAMNSDEAVQITIEKLAIDTIVKFPASCGQGGLDSIFEYGSIK